MKEREREGGGEGGREGGREGERETVSFPCPPQQHAQPHRRRDQQPHRPHHRHRLQPGPPPRATVTGTRLLPTTPRSLSPHRGLPPSGHRLQPGPAAGDPAGPEPPTLPPSAGRPTAAGALSPRTIWTFASAGRPTAAGALSQNEEPDRRRSPAIPSRPRRAALAPGRMRGGGPMRSAQARPRAPRGWTLCTPLLPLAWPAARSRAWPAIATPCRAIRGPIRSSVTPRARSPACTDTWRVPMIICNDNGII